MCDTQRYIFISNGKQSGGINSPFSKKINKTCIFFSEKFGGSQKSSTFALAKRNDTVCSLKF